MNGFKTAVLMTGLLALLMLVGELLGGMRGAVSFLIIGLITNFISYWFSDKIVLYMYGAKETKESDQPLVYKIVRSLTEKAGLPMPKIYVMDSPTPNAFATGRNPEHAAVAVTTGILEILTEDELTGVLAHELAHVKNRDILVSTLAAAIAGVIMMMSRFALFFGGRRDDSDNGSPMAILMIAILAPIAAMIIQLAISRAREYGADSGGAEISGKPLALASALKKLEAGVKRNPEPDASPATAHLFIVSPLSGKSFLGLFSTHPPIPERVQRLETIARNMRAGAKPEA